MIEKVKYNGHKQCTQIVGMYLSAALREQNCVLKNDFIAFNLGFLAILKNGSAGWLTALHFCIKLEERLLNHRGYFHLKRKGA